MAGYRQRILELKQDQAGPQFELRYICDRQIAVVFPEGHDLMFYKPTTGGASTEKMALQDAMQEVFDWLDSAFMLPTDEDARRVVLARKERTTPHLILVLNEFRERDLFNVRYDDVALLEDVVRHYLRPLDHEDCDGVPCAYPGSCGNNLTCRWEIHVPLCEFVNRSAARLLERRFGNLPPAFLGLAEIAEVSITGNHYSYRHWGDAQPMLESSERDGYAQEFGLLLKSHYSKKRQRDSFLRKLLEWEGGSFDLEMYSASWGLAQVLLGHCREMGKGNRKRSLGGLLYAVGQLEEATPEELLAILTEFDPRFLDTYRKPLPRKMSRNGATVFDL